MDTRTTSADFYPGGKTPVTAGGGITSGEAGGAAGEPMVPVTKVEQLPEHYRESDMRSKINELARVISGGVAAIIAMVSLPLGAEPVKVLGVKKDALWNDDFVVTNVVADFAGFATTNTVTGATNALAATFERGLEVATNAVLQAGAKEIAAATNALSQSVDARLGASTNGSFSASSLEPYAKRTWVEAQGYLKSTNLTGYAQVNWVQNQGFIKKENASRDIARIVDEKIAAQDETAAYRLMSADGSQWIDGTGVCWQVTSRVSVKDRQLVGRPDACEWFVEDGDGSVRVQSILDEETGLKSWYTDVDEIIYYDDYDPEAYYTINHEYMAETNPTNGNVTLKLRTQEPVPDHNGRYPPETISLRYWLETNAVNRIAFTNDVSGAITTNDVCAIVTNMAPRASKGSVNYSPWRIADCGNRLLRWYLAEFFGNSGGPQVTFRDGVWTFDGMPQQLEEYTWVLDGSTIEGEENATNIVFEGMYLQDGEEFVDVTFSREAKEVTKVGESYVTPTYVDENARLKTDNVAHESTMAETAGWWKTGIADIRCDDQVVKETLIGMAKDDEIFIVWNQKASCWEFVGLPTIRGYGHGHLYDEPNDRDFQIVFGGTDDEVLFFKNLYSKDGKGIDVEVVRAVKAVAKAGEPFVTTNYVKGMVAEVIEAVPAIVTNIARDVSNSFWDEKNEVLWRLEFRDGEPMFVPVTNENVKATGGVL